MEHIDDFHKSIIFTPKLAPNVDFITPISTRDQGLIDKIQLEMKKQSENF